MCHQSVGLIAQALEAGGVATTSLSTLAWVTRRVRPPRALLTGYPMGYPLGEPGNPDLQRRILVAALSLVERTDAPVLEPWPERPPEDDD